MSICPRLNMNYKTLIYALIIATSAVANAANMFSNRHPSILMPTKSIFDLDFKSALSQIPDLNLSETEKQFMEKNRPIIKRMYELSIRKSDEYIKMLETADVDEVLELMKADNLRIYGPNYAETLNRSHDALKMIINQSDPEESKRQLVQFLEFGKNVVRDILASGDKAINFGVKVYTQEVIDNFIAFENNQSLIVEQNGGDVCCILS